MARILPIIALPDDRLRKPSRALEMDEIGVPEFQQLCDNMVKTMYDDDGIGLAAPQIGENIRLITVGKDALMDQKQLPFSKDEDLILINPDIQGYSWKTEIGEEGCLSVPGYAGNVERHVQLTMSGHIRTGEKIEFVATRYFARVLQHEVDHLNGVLYIDRAKEVWKFDRYADKQL